MPFLWDHESPTIERFMIGIGVFGCVAKLRYIRALIHCMKNGLHEITGKYWRLSVRDLLLMLS